MISAERRRRISELHTDSITGSRFWIDRLQRLGLSPEDVWERPYSVPPVTVDELRPHGIDAFLPARLRESPTYLITSETSGFSGRPVLTCFTQDEFHDGFVQPFIDQAQAVSFPLQTTWLWAGPSGPHIVGKALREILRTVGGTDPFAVDFDPRWFRRQARGNLSARRYFEHILRQIEDIVSRQDVEVLYATPPVVKALAEKWPVELRDRIHGVHYAGMAMSPGEYDACRKAFRKAVHMSGYGNSLFGMFPEVASSDKGILYATASDRLDVQIVRMEDGLPVPCDVGEEGQVMLSRYDESVFILNMVLEDVATRTEEGILDPHRPQLQFEGRLLY